MSTAWESPIMRVTTGKLNTVDDEIVGGVASLGTRPRYGGMLGKHLWVGQDQIENMFDPTVGDLFGGRFRYVRMKLADVVPLVGQVLFWDVAAAEWWKDFQVATEANLAPVGAGAVAVMVAGVCISVPTLGNHMFIQDLGITDILSVGTFTDTAVVGSRMYVDTAVTVGDEGLMDAVDDFASATVTLTVEDRRYLGIAVELPVVDTRTRVMLNHHNALGVSA